MSTAYEQSEVDNAASDDEFILIKRMRAGRGSPITGLNLTAMMDMMTILLVFLIKQYASAPENIPLSDDLRPPASTAADTIQPSVRVMVSNTSVMVDDRTVLRLKDGVAAASDGKSDPWSSLKNAFDNKKSVIDALHDRGGAPFDGNLMVVADEDTPYDIVAKVLYQAGQSKFTTYRLIVRRK